VVLAEHRRQAAAGVSVRNVITSMRLLSAFDWARFFESVSLVDELLRRETDFGAMDFATRDRYRHAIEDVAHGSGRSELEVAALAVERAKGERARLERSGAEPVEAARAGDPGYHLLARGRFAFEREVGFRARPGRRLLRLYVACAT